MNTNLLVTKSVRQTVVACLLCIGLGGLGEAASLIVANNGTDGPGCGGSGSPCRSISQAISNAANGDIIVVGPGRYGDLNDDSDFGDAGEEAAEVNVGCDCMIKVDKPVTIQSAIGASSTILDAGGRPITVVSIITNNVTFGVAKRGLTARRGDFGIVVQTGMTGVGVSANIAADNNNHGFVLSGEGTTVNGNTATCNGDDGFNISGNNDVITGNVALNNDDNGFRLNGMNLTVSGNVASANDNDGFTMDTVSGSSIRGNVVSGNEEHGFELSGVSGTEIAGNSTLGNLGFGFYLSGSVGADLLINGNNIYGNNDADFNGSTNCGLRNESGVTNVNATANFWGNATVTGPGADPADNVCDEVGSGTTTAPTAEKPAKVKLKTAL